MRHTTSDDNKRDTCGHLGADHYIDGFIFRHLGGCNGCNGCNGRAHKGQSFSDQCSCCEFTPQGDGKC